MVMRSNSSPTDKFYRRYAASYVLGIAVSDVPKYTWKQLHPRIYGDEDDEPDPVVLEKYRTTKSLIKGLSGASVIKIIRQAQLAEGIDFAELDVLRSWQPR